MSVKSWKHPVYVLGVALAIAPLSTAGESEAVALQLKLRPGEALWYSVETHTMGSVEVDNTRRTENTQTELYEVVRVLDADAFGAMLVEIAGENVTVDKRPRERIIGPRAFRVFPNTVVGETVYGPLTEETERIIGRPLRIEPENYPFPVPPEPVRIGESWPHGIDQPMSGGRMVITNTYTLLETVRVPEGLVARIGVRTEGGANAQAGGPAAIASASQTTIRGSSEIVWLVDPGRIVQRTSELTVETRGQATIAGQTVRSAASVQFRERRVLLATPPAPPVVAPDSLVLPGRAIGTFLLAESVAALSARLGAPVTEPDARFPSTRLRWPNGLVGHVDPADQTRLIGLEITDRRHRTDRGIGFGSTEGAALIAHGLYPQRADVASARLGGFRALIYQELGVAFLVRADWFGTDLKSEKAQPSTVETLIVFPPGRAAEIFPVR